MLIFLVLMLNTAQAELAMHTISTLTSYSFKGRVLRF